jgi:hypothetical protein
MPDKKTLPCAARRRFLRSALAIGAAVPLAGVGFGRPARAEENKPRAEDGHALDYVSDAADAADHELYEEGQACENCIFWTGEVADGYGGCQHPDFEDVLVNARGWCAAYVEGGA